MSVPRRIVREDSNSSSSCDVRVTSQQLPREPPKRAVSVETEPKPRIETVTSTIVSTDAAIDLTKKKEDRPVRTANFYQETLIDQVQHRSVITPNPTYSSPQPSTSNFATVPDPQCVPKPEVKPLFFLDVKQNNNITKMTPPKTPVTPIFKIDFSKNLSNPEIKVLDTAVASIVGVKSDCKKTLSRQNSKAKDLVKRDTKPPPPLPLDINSGNLQIDEDYDT